MIQIKKKIQPLDFLYIRLDSKIKPLLYEFNPPFKPALCLTQSNYVSLLNSKRLHNRLHVKLLPNMKMFAVERRPL